MYHFDLLTGVYASIYGLTCMPISIMLRNLTTLQPAEMSRHDVKHRPFTSNAQKATIHQVSTSKNVLFPGHSHLLTPPVLMIWHLNYHPSASKGNNWSEGSSAPVVSRWLGPGNRTFLEVESMVVTWWIVLFLPSAYTSHLVVLDNRNHKCHIFYHHRVFKWSNIVTPLAYLSAICKSTLLPRINPWGFTGSTGWVEFVLFNDTLVSERTSSVMYDHTLFSTIAHHNRVEATWLSWVYMHAHGMQSVGIAFNTEHRWHPVGFKFKIYISQALNIYWSIYS